MCHDIDIPLISVQMYVDTHLHEHTFYQSNCILNGFSPCMVCIGLYINYESGTHTQRGKEMFNIEHVNEESRDRHTESNICTNWHMPYVTLSDIKKKMLLTFLIYTEYSVRFIF